MEFKMATLADREEIEKYLNMTSRPSLEYSFTTLYLWQKQFGMEFCIEEGFLFIRTSGKRRMYLFPMGCGDEKSAVDKIVSEDGIFYSLTKAQADKIEAWYPEKYTFTESRDMGDYVYETEALAYLKGKKLSAKRNHINRFIAENPEWSYEEITEDNLEEIKQMHTEWLRLQDNQKELETETVAVKIALSEYFSLGFSGGAIRTGGRIVAFSIGDKLSDSTFLVHIEKAFSAYSGAYQLINREFVQRNCTDYEFVNREDDAGDEGLRKAKLSYRPHHIVTKFLAKPRA
jgi:hypothetical protein